MRLNSWGNYPQAEGKKLVFSSDSALQNYIKTSQTLKNSTIAGGNQRSYGDSAFADVVIDMLALDCFLAFDQDAGILQVQAGVLFADILSVIVPKGWILPVLPGTQFITVGGAIASDVHGKNHHLVGTFCQFVLSMRLLQVDGTIIECSKTHHAEIFHATCAGMGLTGIILDASIQLCAITANTIRQTTLKSKNLTDTFDLFEQHAASPYSVAWIDCLATGENLGKSVVMLGEFEPQGELTYVHKSRFKLPFYLPAWVLNTWSVKLFNRLYYAKAKNGSRTVSLQQFFFPLDGIIDWNKMYGKKGFVQYQCVLPLACSYEAIKTILEKIAAAKQGSFLAVLKRMGTANNNLLSFPLQGYSLALDFKVNKKTLHLLDELDAVVSHHNGRLYLCKDARMSQQTFAQGYANAEKFRQFRRQNGLDKLFNSQQSNRLKL